MAKWGSFTRVPRPGVCVAWLGVYAVVFTMIPPDSPLAKALIIAGAFALMSLEIHVINKDRDAADRRTRRERKRDRAQFDKTLAEFATAHANTERVLALIDSVKRDVAEMGRLPVGDPRRAVLADQVAVSVATIDGLVRIPPDSPFSIVGRPAESKTPVG